MRFTKQSRINLSNLALNSYIDSYRFRGYFYFIYSVSSMTGSSNSADASLDRALHAIADPTRRRILRALKEGALAAKAAGKGAGVVGSCLCAGDIEERVRLSQPTISHHMAILTKAGLVEATRRGTWRWYRRDEKAIRGVVKILRGKL
jgi:DNA-binding transcriptional ArsR family regulator